MGTAEYLLASDFDNPNAQGMTRADATFVLLDIVKQIQDANEYLNAKNGLKKHLGDACFRLSDAPEGYYAIATMRFTRTKFPGRTVLSFQGGSSEGPFNLDHYNSSTPFLRSQDDRAVRHRIIVYKPKSSRFSFRGAPYPKGAISVDQAYGILERL